MIGNWGMKRSRGLRESEENDGGLRSRVMRVEDLTAPDLARFNIDFTAPKLPSRL